MFDVRRGMQTSLQGPSVRTARAFRLWTFHTRPSTFSVSHLQHVAAIPVFQTKRSGFPFHEHSVVPMSKIIQQKKIGNAPHWNFLSSTQYRDFQVTWSNYEDINKTFLNAGTHFYSIPLDFLRLLGFICSLSLSYTAFVNTQDSDLWLVAHMLATLSQFKSRYPPLASAYFKV